MAPGPRPQEGGIGCQPPQARADGDLYPAGSSRPRSGLVQQASGLKRELESGEGKLLPDGEDRGMDPLGKRIHEGVWKRAAEAARRKEKQYGLEELGPWDDFEWRMIN